VTEPVPLPAVPAPVVGAALDGRLHLFSGQPGAEAEHLAVDGRGGVVVAPHPTGLPAVQAVAAGAGELLVACAAEPPVLARVDAGGVVRARVDVPVTGPLASWPRPVHAAGEDRVVWAAGSPGPTVWTWSTTDAAPARLDPAAGEIAGLDAAGGDAAVVVSYGPAAPVQLRRLDGRATATLPGPAAFARVAAAGGGWWVLWHADRELHLARFDADLRPRGPARPIATPSGTERIRDGHLVTDGRDRLAVTVQFAAPEPGRVVATRPGAPPTRAHAQRLRELVLPVGPDGSPGTAVELAEPAVGYRAAGWLDGRLVVVHGVEAPLLTALS
jgi:hypothetical protein